MKKLLYALRADFVKYFGEFRYYQFNYWLGTIMNLVLFTGVVKGISARSVFGPPEFLNILTGFIIWWYGTSVLSEMSIYIQEEALLGTLEQVLTSPIPFPLFIFSRVLAALCRSTFWIIIFLIPTTILFRPYLHLAHLDYLGVLLLAGLSIISFIGLGTILLGLALVFTRVGALLGLIEYALLFLSGVFFSIEKLPTLLRLAVSAIPLTWGIASLRLMVIGGIPLSRLLTTEPFFKLLLTTSIYLIVGTVVYHFGWSYAHRTGRLAHY